MKTKGISFWEQNIERIVLAVAALVCLVLVAMQFLGEPNAVQVAGRSVSPGQVDEELISKAKEMEGKLDESHQYTVDDFAEPVFASFDQKLNTPIVPSPRMVVNAPSIAPVGQETNAGSDRWVEAKVPTLTAVDVTQYFDTIKPEVVDATPELRALLAAAAPYDVTWHTVSAKFDLAGLLKQYAEGGPDGEAPLLLSWYNNRVDFIDLKLEREEYVDGTWTNQTLINPLPGYYSFRVELKDQKIDDAQRTKVLTAAVDPAIRAQIIQPPFYETLTESWTPPGGKAVEQEIAPDDPVGSLKAQRAELQKKLDAVIKTLKKNGCPDTPPTPTEPPPKGTKPERGGGGGEGGSAPGGDISEASGGQQGLRSGGGGAQDLSKCKGSWARKKQFEAQIAKLDAEIQKITGQAAEKPKATVEVAEEPETIIDVWAHDLDVKAGKTYRYRLTVEVYNPLFGRKLDLIPEQQPLAEKFTLLSEPSEWSEPMTAQPPLRMFVTAARPSSQSGIGMALGQVTAEVYRFHNGRWWLESFPVTPGDRVGETKASRGGEAVDYGTDWFVLDVVPTLGATRQDEDAGYGAMVMLQSMSDPSKIEWRSPRQDLANTERRSLNGSVKLADLESEAVASADTGRAGGGATN